MYYSVDSNFVELSSDSFVVLFDTVRRTGLVHRVSSKVASVAMITSDGGASQLVNPLIFWDVSLRYVISGIDITGKRTGCDFLRSIQRYESTVSYLARSELFRLRYK